MSPHALRTEGLRKRYRDHTALDGFDLTVRRGTVHALLGPNGAGKTTAVRALATLLRFDEGRAEVCGLDVRRDAARLRSRISLTGQYAAVDESLSGRQNLVMFGRLLQLGPRDARRRADQLLAEFDLTEAAGRSAGQYSGGMRRRLDLAAAMVRVPEVLFLDEPTTGLDPRSRNQVWRTIRSLLARGTTVLLTTQYLEEADQLADRVSVMNAGRVVAEGTADELKTRAGGDLLEVEVRDDVDLPRVAELLARVTGRAAQIDTETRQVRSHTTERAQALIDAARRLHEDGVPVSDIAVRRPTLDEAFLHLTSDPGAEPHVDRADPPHRIAEGTSR